MVPPAIAPAWELAPEPPSVGIGAKVGLLTGFPKVGMPKLDEAWVLDEEVADGRPVDSGRADGNRFKWERTASDKELTL
jgi:hypothetical protein